MPSPAFPPDLDEVHTMPRTLLRLACAAALSLGIAASAAAQPSNTVARVRTDPFETDAGARFRSYPTQDEKTQLLLDTMTGQLWQVQLRDPFPLPRGMQRRGTDAGRYKLTEPQQSSGFVNRYTLLKHTTQVFSLLDQEQGTMWQVVLLYDNPASTTVSRLEDAPLPHVETP